MGERISSRKKSNMPKLDTVVEINQTYEWEEAKVTVIPRDGQVPLRKIGLVTGAFLEHLPIEGFPVESKFVPQRSDLVILSGAVWCGTIVAKQKVFGRRRRRRRGQG
jgi:hypothetical protein